MCRPVKKVLSCEQNRLNALRARLGARRCYVVLLANVTTITCARRLAAVPSKFAQSGHRLDQRLPNIVLGFPFSSFAETWIMPS